MAAVMPLRRKLRVPEKEPQKEELGQSLSPEAIQQEAMKFTCSAIALCHPLPEEQLAGEIGLRVVLTLMPVDHCKLDLQFTELELALDSKVLAALAPLVGRQQGVVVRDHFIADPA